MYTSAKHCMSEKAAFLPFVLYLFAAIGMLDGVYSL